MEKEKKIFPVPEGYFEDLQQRLSAIPAQQQRVTPWMRLKPYVALAAAFALAVTAGTAILRLTTTSPDPYPDSEWLTEANPYVVADMLAESPADPLTEEEIIQYLIETGTQPDYYETND